MIKWDPTGANILYSTFFGGTVQDFVKGLAVDAQGNCTVAGYTYSPDFPATTTFSGTPAALGPATGFITRLSADGTHLVYSDLLGGSVYTLLQGLALDPSGAAYVTGETAAADFPLSSNAYQSTHPQTLCTRPSDAPFINTNTGAYGFVSKISADGSQLVYSTLITGSCGSAGNGLTVDAAERGCGGWIYDVGGFSNHGRFLSIGIPGRSEPGPAAQHLGSGVCGQNQRGRRSPHRRHLSWRKL